MDEVQFPYVTLTPVPGYRNPKAGSLFELDATVFDFCNDVNATDFKTCIDDDAHNVEDLIDLVLQGQDLIPMPNVTQPNPPMVIPLGKQFSFYLNRDISGEGQRLSFKVCNCVLFLSKICKYNILSGIKQSNFNHYIYIAWQGYVFSICISRC